MANDVEWIKITTDIFDNDKIKLIESMPKKAIAYATVVVWFKLLVLAGKQNNSGVFMLGSAPYTDEMLATIFRMKLKTVQQALETLEQFDMIEIVDGVITIPNWNKYQNLDQLEQAREMTRKRVARHREKQRLLAQNAMQNVAQESVSVALPVTLQVTPCNGDRVRLLEQDKEQDIHTTAGARMSEQDIIDLFNSLCPSFPPVQTISEAQKKKITVLIGKYSADQFKNCFEKVEKSSFLKGGGKTGWKAFFGWIIDETHFLNILQGVYDNKKREHQYGDFDPDEAFRLALERSYRDESEEMPDD